MSAILFITLVAFIITGMPLAYAIGGASFFSVAFGSDLPEIFVVQRFFTGVDYTDGDSVFHDQRFPYEQGRRIGQAD